MLSRSSNELLWNYHMFDLIGIDMTKQKRSLVDNKINIKLRLAALWTSLMFLYIYADYFILRVPGKLESIMELSTPVGPTTPKLLVIFSLILIVPSVMTALSVFLPPRINRWANISIAAVWSSMSFLIIIEDIGDIGGWYTFYVLFQVVEIVVLATIIYQAWKWPRIAPEN